MYRVGADNQGTVYRAQQSGIYDYKTYKCQYPLPTSQGESKYRYIIFYLKESL